MYYTGKQKRQLLEKINVLSPTEHEEIFNILQRIIHNESSVTYTSNKNGIFFNLSNLSDAHISEIEKFVDFCNSNKKDLDDYDKKLNDCKINSNIINIDLETIVEKKPSKISKKHSALPICDWASLNLEQTVDTKSTQRIISFIENLSCERTGKKKINVKFHNAKKKYAKKVISDSKIEYELLGDLHEDPYLVST